MSFVTKKIHEVITETYKVVLYEIRPKTLLLYSSLPLDIPYKTMGNEQFNTPDGIVSGFLFYKTNENDCKLLDQYFTTIWRNNLSISIEEIAEQDKKEPILLWTGNVTVNNQLCSVYVYEYTEKSITLFSDKIDFTSLGDVKKNKFVCPHTLNQDGKEIGFVLWKNSKSLSSIINLIGYDFTKDYKKSVVVNKVSINQPSQSTEYNKEILKTFNLTISNTNTTIDIVDYSEKSLAIFLTPFVQLNIFNNPINLKHPNGNKCIAYCIYKYNENDLTNLDKLFGFNVKSLLPDKEDKPYEKPDFGDTKELNAISNNVLNPTSIIDQLKELPLDTFIKLVLIKFNNECTDEIKSLDTLGCKTIYYGRKDQIDSYIDFIEKDKVLMEININNGSENNKILYIDSSV
jgi:hypothetical protein